MFLTVLLVFVGYLHYSDCAYKIILYLINGYIDIVTFLSHLAENMEDFCSLVIERLFKCFHISYGFFATGIEYSNQVDTDKLSNLIKDILFHIIIPVSFVIILAAYFYNKYKLKKLETKISLKMCCICLVELSDILFLPCKHLCICNSCLKLLKERNLKENIIDTKCPMCRGLIETEIKIFF